MKKTKERQIAVALQYQRGASSAPVVSATGKENIARLMKRVARRYGVPIRHHSTLATELSTIRCEDPIPSDLYQDVALLFHQVPHKSR